MRTTIFMLIGLVVAGIMTFVIAKMLIPSGPTVEPVQLPPPPPPPSSQVVVLNRTLEKGARINGRTDLAVVDWASEPGDQMRVVGTSEDVNDVYDSLNNNFMQVDGVKGYPLLTNMIGPRPPAMPQPTIIAPVATPTPQGPTGDPGGPDIGIIGEGVYEHPMERPDTVLVPIEEIANVAYANEGKRIDIYRLQPSATEGLFQVIPIAKNKELGRIEGPAIPTGVSFYVPELSIDQVTAVSVARAQACVHYAPAGDPRAGFANNIIRTRTGIFAQAECEPKGLAQQQDGNGQQAPVPLRYEDYDSLWEAKQAALRAERQKAIEAGNVAGSTGGFDPQTGLGFETDGFYDDPALSAPAPFAPTGGADLNPFDYGNVQQQGAAAPLPDTGAANPMPFDATSGTAGNGTFVNPPGMGMDDGTTNTFTPAGVPAAGMPATAADQMLPQTMRDAAAAGAADMDGMMDDGTMDGTMDGGFVEPAIDGTNTDDGGAFVDPALMDNGAMDTMMTDGTEDGTVMTGTAATAATAAEAEAAATAADMDAAEEAVMQQINSAVGTDGDDATAADGDAAATDDGDDAVDGTATYE